MDLKRFDTVIFTKTKKRYPKNDGFGTYFASAMWELATSRIPIDALRLMLYLLHILTQKQYCKGNNKVDLFRGKHYEEDLGIKRSNVARAFKYLEENKYIMRDKDTHSIYIIINPKVAYAGVIDKYPETHNQLAIEFGYDEITEQTPEEKAEFKRLKKLSDKAFPTRPEGSEDGYKQDFGSSTHIPKSW